MRNVSSACSSSSSSSSSFCEYKNISTKKISHRIINRRRRRHINNNSNSNSNSESREKTAEEIPPEDYAIVVELLDCDTAKELLDKAELMANTGLITAGVLEASRVILDGNIKKGQDEDIILVLKGVYDVILKQLQILRAPYAKRVLEFASRCLDLFTAEDLELNNEIALQKVRLVLQEEFDKDEEVGVTREALEKYLGDVLPVMDMQDDRLREQLANCEDPQIQVQMLQQMMQRTKERMQIDYLRDVARTFRKHERE